MKSRRLFLVFAVFCAGPVRAAGDAMRLAVFLLALAPAFAHADWSDISGAFQGPCFVKKSDGGGEEYLIRYDIQQPTRNKVIVTTTQNDYAVEEVYELERGITIRGNDDTKVFTGGTFWTEDDSFAGTVLFVNEEGNLDTVLNEYRKIEKNGIKTLLVTQTAPGSRMTCELPAVAQDADRP